MFQFINTLLIGITSGAIYALMALSIVLVWRSTRVINFAQAGQALTSTFIGYQALSIVDSFWIALLIAMVGGALISALIEITLMRVLLKHSTSGAIAGVAPIIATLGLLEVIQATITLIWGGADVLLTPPLSNTGFTIGTNTLVFSPMKLAIIIVVAVLLLLLSLIFQKTSIGLSLRAAALLAFESMPSAPWVGRSQVQLVLWLGYFSFQMAMVLSQPRRWSSHCSLFQDLSQRSSADLKVFWAQSLVELLLASSPHSS
jgi:branched-subunit amino acid ABC-type transport system permease component